MAGGALSKINELLDTNLGMQKQAYEEGRAANLEGQGALSKPRRDLSGLAFSAGLLGGSRSGSFGEELSNGLKGYTDAASAYDDGELDRQTKLAALKGANARLMSQYGTNIFDLNMKRFEAPTVATQYEDDVDRLQNGSGIPKFTPGGGNPEIPVAPPPPAPPPTSSTTPPPPAPNPNATVGSAGSDVLTGGSGQDTLQPGRPPAYPPGQDPSQQGMPQFQHRQIPQAQTDLYNWALQVKQAYARDPDRWARRKENLQALQQANTIIDDYRQMTQGGGSNAVLQELQALNALETLKKARRENSTNPFERALQDDEAKTIIDSRKDADAASKSLNDFEVIEELRKRPVATGPIGQYLTYGLDLFGLGGGQALEGRGADIWVNAVAPLKGALSNTEGARFDAANPGMLKMNDPEAKILIKLGRLAAQRVQQKNAFLEAYRERNGSLAGAPQAWERFRNEKKLMEIDPETGEARWNEGNVNAWDEYVGLGAPPSRAPTDSAPGRQISPEAAREELRRRGVIK